MTRFETVELRGARGTYIVSAHIEATEGSRMTLLLANGRRLVVPTDVVDMPDTRSPKSPEAAPNVARRVDDGAYTKTLRELENAAGRWEASAGLRQVGHSADESPIVERAEWLRLRLEDLERTDLSERHARLIAKVDRVCARLIDRLAEEDFRKAKQLRKAYLDSLQDLQFPSKRGQSKLSRLLRRCVTRLRESELADWKDFSDRFVAHPHIEAQHQMTLNVERNGEFFLPLRIVLDGATTPATKVRVALDQFRGTEVVGQLPTLDRVLPGESKTVRIRLLDRRRQGASSDVRVRVHLNYVGPNNETLSSAPQKFTIQLRARAEFQEIPNPFRDYASGVPVDDPNMFFGREKLIGDIVSHLMDRPVGRCYGLYGQKRSGKSSVSGQVHATLDRHAALVCELSMGTIDRTAITTSFVTEVLDQLREEVSRRISSRTFENLLTRWPDQRELSTSPLASFRKAVSATRALLRQDGLVEPRVILLVDEFTYLFELLRRDHVAESDQNQLRDFMRQWKGWLEARLFSALIVGQDTMPAFLDTFANEFSVMHMERLDYLSKPETESLADRPVVKSDGTSRFTGFALDRIHHYTGGHPFFSQILCDRLVVIANEQRRYELTEFDVDAAVETLLSGPREIGRHRFDCLLSADNTGVLLSERAGSSREVTNEAASRVLHRIALVAGPQNKPVHREELSLSRTEERIFQDLCSRNVLASYDGRHQIRVLLFAEYVRRAAA